LLSDATALGPGWETFISREGTKNAKSGCSPAASCPSPTPNYKLQTTNRKPRPPFAFFASSRETGPTFVGVLCRWELVLCCRTPLRSARLGNLYFSRRDEEREAGRSPAASLPSPTSHYKLQTTNRKPRPPLRVLRIFARNWPTFVGVLCRWELVLCCRTPLRSARVLGNLKFSRRDEEREVRMQPRHSPSVTNFQLQTTNYYSPSPNYLSPPPSTSLLRRLGRGETYGGRRGGHGAAGGCRARRDRRIFRKRRVCARGYIAGGR
jgi:hypothetical protein